MINNIDIKKILLNKHTVKVILALAFVGIILIAFTDFSNPKEEVIKSETNYDYALELELQLKEVVKAITSESSPEVMLTLNSEETYVYATDIKETATSDEKESEENYIVVKNSQGEELGMIITKLRPEIKGVVVVSEFAYDSVIKENIINALMTVLDLPSNKVCVVSKNN